jgi:hypothetical protein
MAQIVSVLIILQKTCGLQRNQPAVGPPLLGNFAEKPTTFLGINLQSNLPSLENLQRKP